MNSEVIKRFKGRLAAMRYLAIKLPNHKLLVNENGVKLVHQVFSETGYLLTNVVDEIVWNDTIYDLT